MEVVDSCVPPGFRFHPTEEELVGYYLGTKVASQKIDLVVIKDVDLYGIEPWDLQVSCRHGHDEQREWYLFSHKDRKYPSGTRTNRATAAGFWKAMGRDKPVISSSRVIGLRKTLVFDKGRAPNGRKTDWLMHEYRLQSSELASSQAKGWVVCRAFQKPTPTQRPCASNVSATYNNSLETTVSMRGNFCDERAVGYSIIPRAEILEGDVVGSDETSAGKKRSNRNEHMMDWKVLDKLLSLSQSNESSTACFLPQFDSS
ncbi:unnamed protein product [Musa acuminata subsp. malaccensis]|uniref:(wild Malaysian banana) hypothetical protein n=1 Tax=Musa acuminata subsp. malaccensis TaxID=214687 RepID=A0A8D7AG57_MUSAM|nr:unnamed protein product [Musa acuminata subsp. malaccensis]